MEHGGVDSNLFFMCSDFLMTKYFIQNICTFEEYGHV